MADARIPLMINQVDVLPALNIRRQGEQDRAAAEQQQFQRQRQGTMDALTIADLAQTRDARGLQMDGQRTSNATANIELQQAALKDIAVRGLTMNNLVQGGHMREAAQEGQAIRRTMITAGLPTDSLDETLALFARPEELKVRLAEASKGIEEMIPRIFTDVRNDKGQIVGQRNTQTGQLSGAPAGINGPEQLSALDQYNLQIKQLEVGKLEAEAETREQDAVAATQQATNANNTLVAQANDVAGYIRNAFELSGTTQGGHLGSALAFASPAGQNSQFRRVLQTVKSNIGFDKLMEMKRNSPTGGALGAVSERELSDLQATLGSLDPRSSDAEIQTVLGKVYDVYNRIATSAGGSNLPPIDGSDGGMVTGQVDRSGAANPQPAGRFQVEVIR